MKFKFKNLFLIFLIILGIILIFTFFDYLAHLIKQEYSVPARYFTNKIIYGTIIGFVTYLFIQRKKLLTKTIIFSLVVGILLQTRYFLEGYSIYFVLLFLVIHFIILFIISYITFRLLNKKLK